MDITKVGIIQLLSLCILCATSKAEEAEEIDKTRFTPLNTAVPSLSIASDARGGAMGDNGTSTLPDINSQYWNASKYLFMHSKAGISLSYTPWLHKLINDIALINLSGYYQTGKYEDQAIGASLRYFSLGSVPAYDSDIPLSIHPYEMAFDFSYSRKLSQSYSMAVALRYIRSDMGTAPQEAPYAGNAFSADISGYLHKYLRMQTKDVLWTLGFNLSNIGTRISYDEGNSYHFLPAKLAIGSGLSYPLNTSSRLSLHLDVSKYLVPTEPVRGTSENEADFIKRQGNYRSMSSIVGIFESFGDSPDGFAGELRKIMISFGAEYSYKEQFFIRSGYFYENKQIGNRQYFSVGAGFRIRAFQIDAAYLVSTLRNNPLDQTLRFTLSLDFESIKTLFN